MNEQKFYLCKIIHGEMLRDGKWDSFEKRAEESLSPNTQLTNRTCASCTLLKLFYFSAKYHPGQICQMRRSWRPIENQSFRRSNPFPQSPISKDKLNRCGQSEPENEHSSPRSHPLLHKSKVHPAFSSFSSLPYCFAQYTHHAQSLCPFPPVTRPCLCRRGYISLAFLRSPFVLSFFLNQKQTLYCRDEMYERLTLKSWHVHTFYFYRLGTPLEGTQRLACGWGVHCPVQARTSQLYTLLIQFFSSIQLLTLASF